MQQIVEFVREKLGCQCPDEVFEDIECREGDGDIRGWRSRILLGGRLLIYLWETNDLSLVVERLAEILVRGKDERDRVGFNRFRAVIATNDIDRIGPAAERIFKNLAEVDDKVHLHVVHVDEIAGLGLESLTLEL